MEGKTINGFTIKSLLGVGGMAEVWLAENKIGKKAAVKLLLPRFCADESIISRFENEAKMMVILRHPNIRYAAVAGIIEQMIVEFHVGIAGFLVSNTKATVFV